MSCAMINCARMVHMRYMIMLILVHLYCLQAADLHIHAFALWNASHVQHVDDPNALIIARRAYHWRSLRLYWNKSTCDHEAKIMVFIETACS